MMRSWIGRDIGHEFEVVSVGQGNVPGDGPAKSSIVDRLRTRMPSEENLDLDIIAPRQPPIKRHGVLNRVRNHKRKGFAYYHSIASEPFSGGLHCLYGDAARVVPDVWAHIRSKIAHCASVNALADHGSISASIAAALKLAARSHAIPSAIRLRNRGSAGLSSNVARKTFGNRRAISTAGLRR